MRSVAVFALLLIGSSVGAQQRPFHVVDYDLSLTLPDTGKRIEGLARLTIVRLGGADTLALDLTGPRVSRVTLAEKPAAFSQDAAHVRVYVGGDRGDRGDTLQIAVEYAGAVTDGLIIGTDSAGRWMAFGDNWPDRARHWIPSIDHPSDKATVTWTVNAPSDRRVVANGALLEERPVVAGERAEGPRGQTAPRTLTRWRESHPIPVYLMVIAAAPLARYDLGQTACGLAEGGGCVEQMVYTAPEQRAALPGEFARAGDMVEFFARLVAPFPYEKLAHVQSSTRFGGMENAGAIFYADAPFRRGGTRAGTIAHETAHQWFGDAVTEREWGHVWLSEGFATYFEQLWTRHAFGDTAFRRELSENRAKILRDGAVATRPVIDTAQTNLMSLLNLNSYDKGGWTLHMLRTLVGDSAFFRGVRDYWTSHCHGTALTDDLMAAVERQAGMPLGWFFDQWLRRPGYASLTTDWRWDPEQQRVVIEMTQGERFAPYRLPLTVAVTEADGTVRRVRVDVPAERSALVTLPLAIGERPRAVAFDPDVELLAEIAVRRTEQSPADRAIAQGRLDDAESALYAAAARAPRDPAARGALGAYLASRGRLKVGAVLLEEARQFGGDARTIDARLEHVYLWTGEWDLVAALPSRGALAEAERARAKWLATHPATRGGPDSSVVPLAPNEVFGLGRIVLVVGGTTLFADIDPNVEGLVLPAVLELREQLRHFGSRADTAYAVADVVAIGTQSLANVPVRLEPDARPRVGLDVLASLTPTFDVGARTLTLRATAKGTPPGEAIPFLLGFPGVKIVPRRGEAPVALESAAGRSAVRGTRWTFDLKSGAIVVR
jgi:aminopeptidase N